MERGFILRAKKQDNKDDTSVVMTIRIGKDIQEQYENLAAKSNYSRNGLISMALQYALDHLQFIPDEE